MHNLNTFSFLTPLNKTSSELLYNHIFNVVEHSWYKCNYTGDCAKIVHSNIEIERNHIGNTNVFVTAGDFFSIYTRSCIYIHMHMCKPSLN